MAESTPEVLMAIVEKTDKDRLMEIVRDQPDDSSYDEILRELTFSRMVERGLADSENGRTLSNAEMDRRISSWIRHDSEMS
jgi:predicted transcriptional regulator